MVGVSVTVICVVMSLVLLFVRVPFSKVKIVRYVDFSSAFVEKNLAQVYFFCMMTELTPKQARFVNEYLIDLNATQAAIRSGYSERTAKSQGQRLLTHVDIKASIASRQHELAETCEVTQERIIRELAKLGFSNQLDYMSVDGNGSPFVDLSTLTRDQAAAIQEFTSETYCDGSGDGVREVKKIRLKLADKRGALVDLGRHLNMFADRVDVNATINVHVLPRGGYVDDST